MVFNVLRHFYPKYLPNFVFQQTFNGKVKNKIIRDGCYLASRWIGRKAFLEPRRNHGMYPKQVTYFAPGKFCSSNTILKQTCKEITKISRYMYLCPF